MTNFKCKECGCDLGPLEIETFCGRCEACDERWCGFARAALTGLLFPEDGRWATEKVSEWAFHCADACMKARRGDK